MTDIICNGKPVKTLRIGELEPSSYIYLTVIYEDGTKESLGYFKEVS